MSRYFFIAGCTRSGSTALGSELASRTGAVHVGELHHFWRSAVEDRLCGCRKRFTDCEFWQAVLKGMQTSTRELERTLQAKIELLRLPRWALASGRSTYWGSVAQSTNRLIESLQSVGGDVVDSGKNPAFLDLLCRQGVAPTVYQTRRPAAELRASWRAPKPDPDAPGGAMPTRNAASVAREGAAIAVAMNIARRRHRLSIEEVRSAGGRFETDLSHLGPRVEYQEHTLAGNPDRLDMAARTDGAR